MFNADDIIRLEKKWLRYKLKQKSKLPIFLLFILLLALGVYFYYSPIKENITETLPLTKQSETQDISEKSDKKLKNEPKSVTYQESEKTSDTNTSVTASVTEETEEASTQAAKKEPKEEIQEKTKKEQKPFYFSLAPTLQKNELFYTEGVLSFTPPYSLEAEDKKPTEEVVPPKIVENTAKIEPQQEKKNVSISMKEVDTTTYLKEKFYSSSNIVFALMLAEEYYNKENFTQSVKWSLTANDIDPSNDKSWFWFAKAKAKMDQKDDAIRALRAYLRDNKSGRLESLLNNLELGVSDD